MKKNLCILLAALLLAGMGCTAARAESGNEEVHILIATDLHYISPEICDFGSYFTHMMDSADSKLTHYCEELTEAFLDEVIADKPAALLLTGDLSFNGARESHAALAEKLRHVEAAGVPVLVLTGNHDVYNRNAACFKGESFTRLTPCTSDDFRAVYRDFGLGEALSVDDDSLSYVYPLSDSIWVLMMDFNTAHHFCGVSKETLRWTEEQLAKAKREGKTLLVAGHQNLFTHSAFVSGYVIDGADELASLLRAYEIPLFLSGHLHIQHWRAEDALTEIATSALSVYPCQYGVLRIGEDSLRYETRQVDVPAWAAAQEKDDPVLLDFPAYAAQVMDVHTGRETEGELKALGFTEQERAEMIAYARELNKAYFSGDLRLADTWDPDGHIAALWASSGTLRDYYMRSVIPDYGHDFTYWKSE